MGRPPASFLVWTANLPYGRSSLVQRERERKKNEKIFEMEFYAAICWEACSNTQQPFRLIGDLIPGPGLSGSVAEDASSSRRLVQIRPAKANSIYFYRRRVLSTREEGQGERFWSTPCRYGPPRSDDSARPTSTFVPELDTICANHRTFPPRGEVEFWCPPDQIWWIYQFSRPRSHFADLWKGSTNHVCVGYEAVNHPTEVGSDLKRYHPLRKINKSLLLVGNANFIASSTPENPRRPWSVNSKYHPSRSETWLVKKRFCQRGFN